MKQKTKNKLFEAWQYCDNNDKSTEFMLQYMQDFANVDLDSVIKFLEETTIEDRRNHFNKPKTIWLEYCKSCKKKHVVTMQKCPDCGVHETPQPISEKVQQSCNANYRCDGCDAYLDHLK